MRSFHFNSADQFIASLSKPSASKLPSISHVSSSEFHNSTPPLHPRLPIPQPPIPPPSTPPLPSTPFFLKACSGEDITEALPSLNFDVYTSEPLSDYSEKERKQFFKQKLLPIVKKMCPQYAEKVTTVLIEMDTKRMIELFADESELQWKIKKTIEFLGW
eukprot:sb/3472928/